MTEVLLVVFLSALFVFIGIVFYGAPYVPTRKEQVEAALDLLDLQPGQMLIELGAGDGRVARAAAQRGIRVTGYELNPILFLIACLRTHSHRNLVTIKWRNYVRAKWPVADGIFLFGADMYMDKIYKKIIRCAPCAKVASFAFQFPDATPAREQKGVFLYQALLAKEPAAR